MKHINEQNQRGVLMEDANLGHGRYGKILLAAGESSPEGVEYSYMVVLDSVIFSTITDANLNADTTTKFVGVEFPTGLILPGDYTTIAVASGLVIFYNDKGE